MNKDLLELKANFTRYYLKNVIKLKCSYSFRIYEFLKQVQGYKNELIIDVMELKIKMQLDNKYLDYFMFKKRVLIPAQKDINARTDIYFTFEEIKQGKKVLSIRFLFNSQETPQEKSAQLCLDFKDIDKENLKNDLLKIGISESITDKILSENCIDKIKYNLEYSKGKKPENLPAYFIDALKKDHAAYEIMSKEQEKKKAEKEKSEMEIEKILKDVSEKLLNGASVESGLIERIERNGRKLPNGIHEAIILDEEKSKAGNFYYKLQSIEK